MKATLLGGALGLAWGAGLRGWMAVLAGEATSFTWSGTFAALLLPAVAVGASLGWAEQRRRSGDGAAWRWAALTPLLFVLGPALAQENFLAGLRSGLGTGAIGLALIGMLGGYAIAGRGPAWGRALSRLAMLALLIAMLVAAFAAPFEQRLAPTTPAGAYTLLAGACAIPHRPVARGGAEVRERLRQPMERVR